MRIRIKDPRLIQMREFECVECGEKQVMPKRKGKTTAGHVKTAYCWKCQKATDHVQKE